MTRKPYPIDPICLEVAEHFLSEEAATDADRRELAEDIQKLCEDFCVIRARKNSEPA